MSTISTLEELEALPEGTLLTHDSNVWRRDGVGLALHPDGGAIGLENFRAFVTELTVQDVSTTEAAPQTPQYHRGQVFYNTGAQAWNVVASEPDSEGYYYRACFYGGLTITPTVIRYTGDPMGDLLTEVPEWLRRSIPVAEQLAAHMERERVRAETVTQQIHGLDEYRSELSEALNTYIVDHTGLTSTERDDLQEVMRDYNLEVVLPTEEVTVRVSVSGEYQTYLDSEFAEIVGGDVTVDMPLQTIEFAWEGEVTKEVTSGECACDEVDDDDVESLLNEEDINFSSFSFDASCSND